MRVWRAATMRRICVCVVGSMSPGAGLCNPTRSACPEQGPWAPRKIANPHYFRDDAPLGNLGSIGAAAVEIWTMDTGYYFDNVLIGSDPAAAAAYRTSHWAPKLAAEVWYYSSAFVESLGKGCIWPGTPAIVYTICWSRLT